MDIVIWALIKLQDRLSRGVPVIGSTIAAADLLSNHLKGFIPDFAPVQLTGWTVTASIVGLFVFKEFVDYTIHYCQHHVPLMWELHKVHHTALYLIPLTARRVHPLELLIQEAISGIMNGAAFGFCGFLFDLTIPKLILYTVVLNTFITASSLDTLRHSHFGLGFGWLDRVFISPQMHHVHHSKHAHHWDRNFGVNLSIFDWLFGTAYKPRQNEDIAFGIGNEEEERAHSTLSGALAGPLLKMWSLVFAPRAPVVNVLTVGTSGEQTQGGE